MTNINDRHDKAPMTGMPNINDTHDRVELSANTSAKLQAKRSRNRNHGVGKDLG